MLQILNHTPFDSALALITDQHGANYVVVAVKGTFEFPASDGSINLAEDSVPVYYTDQFLGEPGESSITHPADFVLGKLGTDIGFIGDAHSPGGRPVRKMSASLQVGQQRKTVAVFGDRRWRKRALSGSYSASEPEPFTRMPIVYERAFGGIDQTARNEKEWVWDRRNPIGMGLRLAADAATEYRFPNVEDPRHLISSWRDRPPPACFGFIQGSWEPRCSYAGTYDENWLEHHSPLLPADFDPRFHNRAAPGLVSNHPLRGGEPVELINLSPEGKLRFHLPKLEVNLMFRIGHDQHSKPADIWTLVIEPEQSCFCIVWGQAIEVGNQPSRMKYVKVTLDGEAGIVGSRETNL